MDQVLVCTLVDDGIIKFIIKLISRCTKSLSEYELEKSKQLKVSLKRNKYTQKTNQLLLDAMNSKTENMWVNLDVDDEIRRQSEVFDQIDLLRNL